MAARNTTGQAVLGSSYQTILGQYPQIWKIFTCFLQPHLMKNHCMAIEHPQATQAAEMPLSGVCWQSTGEREVTCPYN